MDKQLTKILLKEISRLKAKNKKLKKELKQLKKETTRNQINPPTIQGSETLEKSKNKVHNSLQELLNTTQENTDLAIAYTDGSFNQTKKKAGYGIVLFHHGKTFKESGKIPVLPSEKISSQSGETYAVIKAIDNAIKLQSKTIIIYYDCTNITEWLENINSTNIRATWYYKHLTKRKEKIEIIFKKVKAHSGNLCNNEADQLAKKAIA